MPEIKKIKGGSFKSMDLHSSLFHNIHFENPTPIQRRTIPPILEGRSIMGIARTGSGKTLCYLIPAIQRASEGLNTLILLPTKELVQQVKKIYKILSFRVKCEGRVDICTLKSDLDTSKVDLLVVDEVDRVFEEPSLLEHFTKLSESLTCQRIYFSATLPDNPIDIKIIQIENKIPEAISHSFFYVPSESKDAALLNVLDKSKKTIIFTATRYSVDFILAIMSKHKYDCRGIYSSMDDDARKTNFNDFAYGSVNFLVVTDVAARGIDIPQLDVSISYDLCDEKTFVHRVGRIRGMGHNYSFVTYSDVFHFFNIKETHLPHVEIGTIPQDFLDKYDFSEFDHLKITAVRGYQRCLAFRKKVVVPSEFKKKIDSFPIHPRFKLKDTLADQIKKMNARKVVEEVTEVKKDFRDQFYIPYSAREMVTHSSAFGVNRDDYINERKPNEQKRRGHRSSK